MNRKSGILILMLVLLAPLTSAAYPSLINVQAGTIKPITYLPTSDDYIETLGITASFDNTVLVSHFFNNITLETPFTANNLTHVSLLSFSFVGGTWDWNYWQKPFWKAPLGASMKIIFQGIAETEVSSYVQKAKALSLMFANMYNLNSTVIYLLEHQGKTLTVGLYAQCDVDSVIGLWAKALPTKGFGTLINTSVIKDSPFKYLGISLSNPKAGTTLGSVSAIYVRTGAISVKNSDYTLSFNKVLGNTGSIAASEKAEESFIYLAFPYLVNMTSVTPEPTYPSYEDWVEWSKESGESERESDLRRATYGLCGLLIWDMEEIESTPNIAVVYSLNFSMERLTHRPMILATTTLQPPKPTLGQEANLVITLKNVGNETAKNILVRPLVFPWLFTRIFEAIYDNIGNWNFLPDWVSKSFLSNLVSSIYKATGYVSMLGTGETKSITRTLKFSDFLSRKFFENIKSFYFPMGCSVLYSDKYHRSYMVTSNGYFTGIGTISPSLISTLTLDKYLVQLDETVKITLSIKNLGDAPVNDVAVRIVAVSNLRENLAITFMEQNYGIDFLYQHELEEREMLKKFNQLEVYNETVKTIPAGGTHTITIDRKIPWLGGSSSLVASITFPSNWQNQVSTGIWGRLSPHYREKLPNRLLILSNTVNVYLVPSKIGPVEVSQPKLEISKAFSTKEVSIGSTVDVTVRVRNIGKLPANVNITDLIPTGCNLLRTTVSSGSVFQGTIGGERFRVTALGVRNLEIKPGQTAYLNYTLRVVGDISGLDPPVTESAAGKVIIGPATVTYISDQPTIDPGIVENSEVLVAGNSASLSSSFSLVGYMPVGDSDLLPRSLTFMGILGVVIALVVFLLLSRRGH